MVAGSATAQEALDFCARLAPQPGMRQDAPKPGKPVSWRVNMPGGLGTALFGGSTFVTFQPETLDGADLADQQRIADFCGTDEKGIKCRGEGPTRLKIQSKRGLVNAADRAEVEMRKATIYCRAAPAA